jgi:hypothetical protein
MQPDGCRYSSEPTRNMFLRCLRRILQDSKRPNRTAGIAVRAKHPSGMPEISRDSRSETETPCLLGTKTRHPGKGARNEGFCDPARVELVVGRIPGVAAFGLTPG